MKPMRSDEFYGTPASFPSGPRWYVVQTNIRCEKRAEMGLAAEGFRVFLPRLTRWKSHARLRAIGTDPLFPRYLFIEADFNRQPITAVRSTHGVESIINNNGVPASIYSDFVINLIERQMEGEFDVTKDEPPPQWAKMAVMDGKYEDCIGIIAKMKPNQRVELLINIMGRKERATLQLAQIRPAW